MGQKVVWKPYFYPSSGFSMSRQFTKWFGRLKKLKFNCLSAWKSSFKIILCHVIENTQIIIVNMF